MLDDEDYKDLVPIDLKKVRPESVLIIFLIMALLGFGFIAISLNESYQTLAREYETLHANAKSMCPYMFPDSVEPLQYENLAVPIEAGG